MASFNKIVLMGNLTRDPEVKQVANNNVCRLGIASNRQYRNKQSGEMVQEVCFIDVDVWGAQADSCRQYLSKGRPVLVEGRLKYDSWQDQDGKARSRHTIVAERVVFLSAGGAEQSATDQASSSFEEPLEPRNEVERELMSQLDEIKNRKKDSNGFGAATAPRKTAVKSVSSLKNGGNSSDNELAQAFKDEPPFQDDLPF